MSILRIDVKPEVLAWLKELENIGTLGAYLESLYECNAEPWYRERVLLLESEGAPSRAINRLKDGWRDAIRLCGTSEESTNATG